MTVFEKLSLLISVASLFATVAALIYAALQLKKVKEQLTAVYRTNEADHDWNRRMAAQTAIKEYSQSVLLSPLQAEFDYINRKEAIPLQTIQEKLRTNASLQLELHKLLNFYEGLARGVYQSIYDEEVIKSARYGAMVNTLKAFGSYIENRRTISPNAWCDLDAIVSKWVAEERLKPNRMPTHASAKQKT